MVEKERRGQGPLHRPEEDGKLERRLAKVVGRDRWFRKSSESTGSTGEQAEGEDRVGGGSGRKRSQRENERGKPETRLRVAAPLFVPATADGSLAENLRREEEKLGEVTGWKYKVVERSGRKLGELLSAANVFQQESCGRERCRAHKL